MTPAPSIEELQAQLVDAQVLRWEPGMLRTDGVRHATHRRPALGSVHPVLRDWPTWTRALAQVRELLGDPDAELHFTGPPPMRVEFYMGNGAPPMLSARSVPEAVGLMLLKVGKPVEQDRETYVDPDQLPLFPSMDPRKGA